MIRAVYRWEVAPGSEPEFRHWWHQGTLAIRRDRAGALGSVLLRTHHEPHSFVAVARWRSQADLEAFWESGGGTPIADATMVSVEILDELDDLEVR
jgi:heme-degrading monooxygenase HmoA